MTAATPSVTRSATSPRDPAPSGGIVTAADWFGGGRRVPYDPESKQMTSGAVAAPTLHVFERVAAAPPTASGDRWATFLPGFPDGSYGYAQVDRELGDAITPRLFLEYVGQGDSDKPRDYRYSTRERADLVEAQWRAHGVHDTTVVSFDYSSLVVLELLARQEEAVDQGLPVTTRLHAVVLVNGGLFADSHSHPWQTTPLLKGRLGALSVRSVQRSPFLFGQILRNARMFSRSYHLSRREIAEEFDAITRRDGAAFMHSGAGFVDEHKANAERWDLARRHAAAADSVRFVVAGSEADPFEHRQIASARTRIPGLDIRMLPGGHMTTSEHPALLAELIRELAG